MNNNFAAAPFDVGMFVLTAVHVDMSAEFIIKEVVRDRENGRAIVEESLVQSRGSLGIAERTAQEVEGKVGIWDLRRCSQTK